MKEIDWDNIPDEGFLGHFDSLNPNDAIDFLIDQLKNDSNLDIDWLEMVIEIKEDLVYQHKANKIEEFLALYNKAFPGKYEKEFQYIEKILISYYLFTGNKEKVRRRLEVIKKNPVAGIDTVTITALYQLIYHGYYAEALDYAKAVWEPIYESKELFGNPHYEFTNVIYLNALEEKYIRHKEGEPVDWEKFALELQQDNLGEKDDINDMIQNTLNPINMESIKEKIIAENDEIEFDLSIQFLKFMKERFNLPFLLSHSYWRLLIDPDLFDMEDGDPDTYFYIPYNTLDKLIARYFDPIFHSNTEEIFGKIWGLDYVYLFLFENGLIDRRRYDQMLENISVVKVEFLIIVGQHLWKMGFIKDWPKLPHHEPNELEIFLSTFGATEDYPGKLKSYVESIPIPDRIRLEFEEEKGTKKAKKSTSFFGPSEPYIKTADVGRNDLCPCGSGKKYKKCCL